MPLDDRTTRVIRGWVDEAQNMPKTVLTTPDRMAADLARAWDEGYRACVQDVLVDRVAPVANPYRQDES